MKTKLLSLLIILALIPGFLPVPVQAQTTVTVGQINKAIDDGVAWLAAQQNANGSWSGPIPNEYTVGITGLAVLKLEEYAFERGYDGPFDPDYPYSDNVTKGLEYIFKHANEKVIEPQQHTDIDDMNYWDYPDAHVSGDPQKPYNRGVSFWTNNKSDCVNYETGICMMAIAASRCPDKEVMATGSWVNGWTYKQVLCEAVDYVAYAQTDKGTGRGGWSYSPNPVQYADNSVSGYVVSGLLYAENPLYGFCCEAPQFVKDELGGKKVAGSITNNWITTVQHPDIANDPDRGGSAYFYPGDDLGVSVSSLKTGNLLSEMAFVDENKTTSTRFQRALEYIERHWHDTDYKSGLWGWGWGYNLPQGPAFYQAAYCLMKGLQAMGISTIQVRDSAGNIIIHDVDWYQELADVIVPQQDPGGFWADSPYEVKTTEALSAGPLLSTIWALLTLERSAPPPPCECEGWSPVTASWMEANGSPGTWTGKCGDTITIASVNAQNPIVTVSTSENCSFGCAASENWTVTSSLGTIVGQDDGATAMFTPASGESYTVTFNATCGRGATAYPSECGSVSDNISCDPCSVVITVGDNIIPPQPCDCLGWNPVTVTWTDCNDIQGMKTGQCDTNLIIPQMECGTTVKVSSSESCSCLDVVTQVPASYEFQPNAVGLYPVTLTANCGDITCPPCNMGILVRNCVKVEASIEVVTNSSLCPQLFTLTGKPDNMSEYKWTNLSSSKVEGYGQSLVVDATNWTPGDYDYTLTVTDANGCTDNETVAVNVVGFPGCQGCNCEWKLVIDIGWGNTPQKCLVEPCACIDTYKPLYYFPKFCWPEEKPPPSPCEPGCKCVSPADEQKLGLNPGNCCPNPCRCRIGGDNGHCYREAKASLSVDPSCACLTLGTAFNINLTGTITGANSWTLTASVGNSSNVIASAQNLDPNQPYQVNKLYTGVYSGPITFTLTANGPLGSDTATVTWEFCPHQLEITSFTGVATGSFPANCDKGVPWDLAWQLTSVNAPANWQPTVVISIKCPNLPSYLSWISTTDVDTFTGLSGSTSFTLPENYCHWDCYFLLQTWDCAGNAIEAQIPLPGFGKGKEPPPPPPTACTGNCDCLTEKEALDLGYTTLCQQEPCSAPGEPQKFCYSRCPEGCYCVTEKEADDLGYTISCSDEKCDPTSKEAKYCFSPPLQPCSQRCQCLTQAQAKEYGYSDAQRCQTTPCKQDPQGKDMYCYPKPKAPVVDVTADRSFVTLGGDVRVCWEVAGEGITEVLFSAAGGKPTPVDPRGCKTFKPTQQTRYLVTAKNAAGSGQDAVTVGVGQPPPPEEVCPTITSFTANCPTAQPGTPAAAAPFKGEWTAQPCTTCCTASWSVVGPAGTTVSISGIGNVGLSGSTQVQRGATYTLTARYGNCVRTASVQVPKQ